MNSKSYFIVVMGILIAKVIGFSRDIVFANFYGTGLKADVYFQIFGFVILIFAGIAVTLQTNVIMGLNQTENDTETRKKQYVSDYLKRTTFWLAMATLCLYLFAKPFTKILLPSLTGEDFEMAVRLSYIMFPSLIFICIAYIISGVLQNNNVFFIPSIISLPYNVVIIASLFLPDVTIEQIGIATTIGWFLHIGIQLPSFYKKGYRFFYREPGQYQKSHFRMQGRLDLSLCWIFLSNLMFQLCFIIDKSCVSDKVGEASVLNYGSNLFTTIAGIFVTGMSSVIFPKISRSYQEGNREKVRGLVGYMVTMMCAIFVPYLLVVSLYGEQLIGILYERGEFTAESTIATAIVFCIYSFGILGYVAEELTNKVLYLAKEYKVTLGGTIVVVCLKLVLDVIFVPHYGTRFAALTTTILITAYAILTFAVLKKHIGNFMTEKVWRSFGKIGIAAMSAFVVYLLQRFFMPELVAVKSPMFLLSVLFCGAVYLGTGFLLGLHKDLMAE